MSLNKYYARFLFFLRDLYFYPSPARTSMQQHRYYLLCYGAAHVCVALFFSPIPCREYKVIFLFWKGYTRRRLPHSRHIYALPCSPAIQRGQNEEMFIPCPAIVSRRAEARPAFPVLCWFSACCLLFPARIFTDTGYPMGICSPPVLSGNLSQYPQKTKRGYILPGIPFPTFRQAKSRCFTPSPLCSEKGNSPGLTPSKSSEKTKKALFYGVNRPKKFF